MAKEKTDALALVGPKPLYRRKVPRKSGPNRKDMIRYYLSRKGHSPEEIAERTGCTLRGVESSLRAVEEYRELVSNDAIDMKIGEVVMESISHVPAVFKRGMTATRMIRNPATGKAKLEPDIAMQLKTVETMKSFQELARPKVPGVMLNQQFNNGGPAGQAASAGTSFESRLRAIREKRGLINEQNVIEITDEEANAEMTLEDELAEQGIDIEESEEDESTS